MKTVFLLLFIVCTAGLTGCGQKGPLVPPPAREAGAEQTTGIQGN